MPYECIINSWEQHSLDNVTNVVDDIRRLHCNTQLPRVVDEKLILQPTRNGPARCWDISGTYGSQGLDQKLLERYSDVMLRPEFLGGPSLGNTAIVHFMGWSWKYGDRAFYGLVMEVQQIQRS
mmetsp:Transcript_6477/g.10965  ORF Transcript_6477/g.10965 Transcript_6477/m.10965 type:complete len:123 (-) Transcript_6477:61-429(-)